MIHQLFLTNVVLILIAVFIDDFFKLSLKDTKANAYLSCWVVVTLLSAIAYIFYLIWG